MPVLPCRRSVPGVLIFLALCAAVMLAAGDDPSRADAPLTTDSARIFEPPYLEPRRRFGFDSGALSGYDVSRLGAGWYTDWRAGAAPAYTTALSYVQVVRLHEGFNPYDAEQVIITPTLPTIRAIALAHPGSLWLLGNEPDSVYQGEPILPGTYAGVYHKLCAHIKGADPTARIANGAIVEPTPCRMQYLDAVWNAYRQAYGSDMPVDIWNIHAFILPEVHNGYGASTPPGIDPSCGRNPPYAFADGDSIDLLRAHLIAFRQWMKARGQQNKPLIISEYGVLWWAAWEGQLDESGEPYSTARVTRFMTSTFDLFLNETDPDIGFPADGGRLVQAWAWYSLSDDSVIGALYSSQTRTLLPAGAAYADYVRQLPQPRAYLPNALCRAVP